MGRPRRVLIVEDESLTAMALSAHLVGLGYEVLELSATGEDAVMKARTEAPDILFMDIRLAGAMDGIEAATIISTDQRIPIVFMTGYSNRAVLERASLCKPAGYLVKPIDFSDIDGVLSSIAGRSED